MFPFKYVLKRKWDVQTTALMASYHDVCFHCWEQIITEAISNHEPEGCPSLMSIHHRLTGDEPVSSSYNRPPAKIQLHAVPYNYRCDPGGLWRSLRHAVIVLTSQWYTFLRTDSKWPSWIRTSEKQVFLEQGKNHLSMNLWGSVKRHPDAMGGKEERQDSAGMAWGRGTSTCPLPCVAYTAS